MQVEITPEPTPEEREALLVALKRALGEERDGPGAWWKAGVRENDEVEPAEP